MTRRDCERKLERAAKTAVECCRELGYQSVDINVSCDSYRVTGWQDVERHFDCLSVAMTYSGDVKDKEQ